VSEVYCDMVEQKPPLYWDGQWHVTFGLLSPGSAAKYHQRRCVSRLCSEREELVPHHL